MHYTSRNSELTFLAVETDFEKSNEIFFRLGIIYKQQRKSQQSLEVRSLRALVEIFAFLTLLVSFVVFPLHSQQSSSSSHGDRHLVPNWSCLRATTRCMSIPCSLLGLIADGNFPSRQFIAAKESYERVLQENPAHAKVLQQLGGLYHRSHASFYNPEISVQILTKSLESGEFTFHSVRYLDHDSCFLRR